MEASEPSGRCRVLDCAAFRVAKRVKTLERYCRTIAKGIPMQEQLNPGLIERLNAFTDDFLSDEDNGLDKKTIELIAVAVSVCVGCVPCTDFHVAEAKRCGATSDEINKVFKIVMAVNAGRIKVFSRDLKCEF
jgi:AhpD family alkylhydroperoxidase